MKKIVILAIFTLLITPCISFAGEWSGDGDLGYNSVSGNSDSQSLALGLGGGYKTGKWSHAGKIDAYNASQDGQTNAKSYSLKFQSDYDLSETSFVFGNVRYLDDEFSGYERQASLTLGAGRTFIEDGNNLLSGQIGAGYRTSELRNNGGSEDEPVVTGGITYNRDLTETTIFESKWSAEVGSDKNGTYLSFLGWPFKATNLRASSRGLVNSGYAFGLRLTALGSILFGLFPTRCCAIKS